MRYRPDRLDLVVWAAILWQGSDTIRFLLGDHNSGDCVEGIEWIRVKEICQEEGQLQGLKS